METARLAETGVGEGRTGLSEMVSKVVQHATDQWEGENQDGEQRKEEGRMVQPKAFHMTLL